MTVFYKTSLLTCLFLQLWFYLASQSDGRQTCSSLLMCSWQTGTQTRPGAPCSTRTSPSWPVTWTCCGWLRPRIPGTVHVRLKNTHNIIYIKPKDTIRGSGGPRCYYSKCVIIRVLQVWSRDVSGVLGKPVQEDHRLWSEVRGSDRETQRCHVQLRRAADQTAGGETRLDHTGEEAVCYRVSDCCLLTLNHLVFPFFFYTEKRWLFLLLSPSKGTIPWQTYTAPTSTTATSRLLGLPRPRSRLRAGEVDSSPRQTLWTMALRWHQPSSAERPACTGQRKIFRTSAAPSWCALACTAGTSRSCPRTRRRPSQSSTSSTATGTSASTPASRSRPSWCRM